MTTKQNQKLTQWAAKLYNEIMDNLENAAQNSKVSKKYEEVWLIDLSSYLELTSLILMDKLDLAANHLEKMENIDFVPKWVWDLLIK